MIIYLLSGWSGSGKDTVASFLKTYGFQRYSFADELKRMVADEFQFPYELTQTQEGKQQLVGTTGKTVRDLLIQRGKEIKLERHDPGFFATIVVHKLLKETPEKVVITDWRLSVEYDVLKQSLENVAKLVTIRVKRLTQTCSPVNDAVTEHELDEFPFDIILENKGTRLEELEEEVSKKLV